MANGWGGARPGSGRKKNGINRISKEAREAAEKSGQMPDVFLLEVMRNESLALGTRIEAARAVLPYLKPRLSSSEVSGTNGGPLQFIVSADDLNL
jgi:hypothetical protein